MLKTLLRSFGPSITSRGTTGRPGARRSRLGDSAIERLEARMLLSAASQLHFTDVAGIVTQKAYWFDDPESTHRHDTFAEFKEDTAGLDVVAAFVSWYGWFPPGQRNLANLNDTIEFDGVQVKGDWITSDGSPTLPAHGFFLRADVTHLFQAGKQLHTVKGRNETITYHQATLTLVVRDSSMPARDVIAFGDGADRRGGFRFDPVGNLFAAINPETPTDPLATGNRRPIAADGVTKSRLYGGAPYVSGSLLVADPDGDRFSVELVSPPTVGGTVTLYSNEMSALQIPVFTFEGEPGFTGTVTFTYRVFDGLNYSQTATHTVIVTPDQPPVLSNQTFTMERNGTLTGRVLFHDPDGDYHDENFRVNPDGERHLVELQRGPGGGTLVVDPMTGLFTYTPPKGFVGVVSWEWNLWGPGATGLTNGVVQIVIEASKPETPPRPEVPSKPERPARPNMPQPPKHEPETAEPTPEAVVTIDAPPQDIVHASSQPADHDDHSAVVSDREAIRERRPEFSRVVTVLPLPNAAPKPVLQPVAAVLVDAAKQFGAVQEAMKVPSGPGIDAPYASEANAPAADVIESRDTPGDVHEDLLAVFERDWAELWNDREVALST